jgi:plasmid stabilization system protein ParE
VNRRLVFRPQAEFEITEAADWYEEQGVGLGAEFLRVLDACIATVERNPHQYPRVHGEVRRAPLRRFPYGLIYRVHEKEILIVACIHARRDPKHWQDRH